MHRADPIVRDIEMTSATDKAAAAIDASEAARNRELQFGQSKCLIYHSDHILAQRAIALLIHFGLPSVCTAVGRVK